MGTFYEKHCAVAIAKVRSPSVGTVLGDPSVAELIDLVAAKDYEIAQLEQAYADFSPTWVQKDSAAYVAWVNDWTALKTRYAIARSSAETDISIAKISPVPNNAINAKTTYNGILFAMSPVPNTVSTGSLQDIYNRITAAGGKVDMSKVPQPKPGTDLDLNLLNTLKPLPGGSGNPAWDIAKILALLAAGIVIVVTVPVLAAGIPVALASRRQSA
jgi:hypothetical protein